MTNETNDEKRPHVLKKGEVSQPSAMLASGVTVGIIPHNIAIGLERPRKSRPQERGRPPALLPDPFWDSVRNPWNRSKWKNDGTLPLRLVGAQWPEVPAWEMNEGVRCV
jgi:hypothetical protein